MSQRHDDADQVEHDPTGMRELLGSLPDPGPMPDHLVARITAALQQESRARAEGSGTADAEPVPGWSPPPAPEALTAAGGLAGPGDAGDAAVVPLRRRRMWVLGAAAAAVVVLGLGGVVVDRLSEGGLVASLGVSQGGDDAGTAESAADGAAPESAAVAEDSDLGVVVVATGTDYSAASLGGLAAVLPTTPGTDGGGTALRDDDGASGGLAAPSAARSCADGLGIAPGEAVTVDLSTFDGHDAAVVVATAADGTARAWAVERGCTATDPGVIEGPVRVG